VDRTFSRRWPTDGLWYPSHRDGLTDGLPLAAVEVLVSEGAKSIRGSVGVLEAVSPVLGVVVLHDEDIARRLRQKGKTEAAIAEALDCINDQIEDHIEHTRQRIQLWTFSQLKRRHDLAAAAAKRK
jgi:hypothetical protein